MNNIFAKRRARLLAMKAIRDNYVPGDRLVACPKCGGESQRKDVAGNLSVCPLCGYHFPIGAYYRLSTILDPGSFRELNAKLSAADPLSFPGYREKQRAAQRKTGLTEAAVTAALDVISAALAEGDEVRLVGFGTFEVKKRAARTGRNPKTKEPVEIPASKVPAFKPGKALKDAVAQ